ncbi:MULTISPECIES: carbon storage regulator CsrA [unclassified Caloramator]|jgi:carbon storage regulator|uniref:carbon storage regulator CsrA n=1 Tax=unclassified Caloramator TaxID=2629145 RepID=UPI00237D3C99|nr:MULTISPECIES: carbon storage regulator CsrA [unclassified Caloramator]MDO6355382.1 carbon storage regulator CsrA [Caloramator sp. CAR-1]WDU83947.1 carbon storage regulator CsrA [Caloramator sp. Dgby_cultured_2]
MLILTRKEGESILIGEGVEIKILEISQGTVKIGIEAPKNVKVIRKELLKEIREENLESLKNVEKILKGL